MTSNPKCKFTNTYFGVSTYNMIDSGKESDFGVSTDNMIDSGEESDFGVSTDNMIDSGEESDFEDNVQLSDDAPTPNIDGRVKRLSNPQLPSTVNTLTTEDGCTVYLVGTAHFSTSSWEDVTQVCT